MLECYLSFATRTVGVLFVVEVPELLSSTCCSFLIASNLFCYMSPIFTVSLRLSLSNR
jgi:hypothetical protein